MPPAEAAAYPGRGCRGTGLCRWVGDQHQLQGGRSVFSPRAAEPWKRRHPLTHGRPWGL